jgi:hypothetical protein
MGLSRILRAILFVKKAPMAAGSFLFCGGLDASGNDASWVSDATAAGTGELSGAGAANAGALAPQEITR